MPATGAVPTDPAQVLAVIPARHGSQRFPGKPLAELAGRPVIAHVVRRALAARRVGSVLVASDHEGILEAAREAGAEAVLTRADHATGSDRIGEAVAGREAAIVLNLQGDEPLVPSDAVDELVELLDRAPWAAASTLACPLAPGEEGLASPNVVKVVAARDGRALYFSRAPIPGRHPSAREAVRPLRHVGLYGYRRPTLGHFLAADPSPLERTEGLEQLRLLELGLPLVVGLREAMPPGVDTPEDLAACARLLAGGGG